MMEYIQQEYGIPFVAWEQTDNEEKINPNRKARYINPNGEESELQIVTVCGAYLKDLLLADLMSSIDPEWTTDQIEETTMEACQNGIEPTC